MNSKWIVVLALVILASGCYRDGNKDAVAVRVDPDTEYQRVHGFGTSMVNYKEFPPEYFQEDFLDLIVNDLGISILRVPITEHLEYANDDEGDPGHYHWDGFYLSNNHRRRGMEETFRFVTEMKSRGVELFMASPWSPPQYMKTNRAPIQVGFLRTDMYYEFAEYLSAFIMLSKVNWDVDIQWISLQNESIFIEFYRSCLYHGFGMKEAVRAVSGKFRKEGIRTRLLINEDILFPERVHAFLEPVFEDPETRDFPGDIAIHRRAGGEELTRWVELTRDFGREYHMTETSGHRVTWKGAMNMAVDMHEYLVLGNFSSWIYWQISGNTGGSNPGFYTLMLEGKPTPKYYAAKHFYRNIRPGALRIGASTEADSLLVSAYKHPATGAMTIVLINNSDKALDIRLDEDPGIPGKFEIHLSTRDELYTDPGRYRPGEVLHIPASSILSLTGSGRELREPGKVLDYPVSWEPPSSLEGKKLGNTGQFPINSEWQGASDRHVGRFIQAEEAAKAGEIDRQRSDGWTLLHESILNGDGEAVKYLLAHGADVNKPARDGWTPLHAAASGFVGNRGIQVKYKEYSHYEIFRMVLESGADIRAVTLDGWTPLHCAVANAYTGYRQAESTSLNRIRDLIREGAPLEARDTCGRTPLHWAAMQGYYHYHDEKSLVEEDVVRILVEAGARVNARDHLGRTPLHYAATMGYESIASELVKGGASPKAPDAEGITPLDIAMQRKAEDLIGMLTSVPSGTSASTENSPPGTDDPGNVDEALILAAIAGDEIKIRDLLREGADITYRDGDGFRAVDRAMDNGHNDIVTILLEAEKRR